MKNPMIQELVTNFNRIIKIVGSPAKLMEVLKFNELSTEAEILRYFPSPPAPLPELLYAHQ